MVYARYKIVISCIGHKPRMVACQSKGDGNDGRSDSNDGIGKNDNWTKKNDGKALFYIFPVVRLLAYLLTVLYGRACFFHLHIFAQQQPRHIPVTGSIHSIFNIHHRETGTYTRSIRIIPWQNICLALTPRNMALSYMHSHCYCGVAALLSQSYWVRMRIERKHSHLDVMMTLALWMLGTRRERRSNQRREQKKVVVSIIKFTTAKR